jgi:transcriptional regulator with XRE-family HTH domain
MAVKAGIGRGKRRRTILQDGPDPVDVNVGRKIRQRRTLLGMSQERLAELFGVSFQQVQKYERGTNRVSASRLHLLSKLLDVPVSFFFEGLEDKVYAVDAPTPAPVKDKLASRETLELVRAYNQIEDEALRERLVDLARSLSD